MTAELKKWRRIFTGLASIWSNIFTNSNEKKTCLLLCLLCIFKFQTLTCRNFWIFYFKSRLTLHIFNSKLDYCLNWSAMATKILNHCIAQSATQWTPIMGVLFNISMAHVQLIRDFDYWPLNREEKRRRIAMVAKFLDHNNGQLKQRPRWRQRERQKGNGFL